MRERRGPSLVTLASLRPVETPYDSLCLLQGKGFRPVETGFALRLSCGLAALSPH